MKTAVTHPITNSAAPVPLDAAHRIASGLRFGFFADSNSRPGHYYVVTRSGNTWTQQAKVTAGDAGGNDWFGYAAALSGDTAAIGAPREDGAANNAGSVYVFTRSGAAWTQQAKLTANDAGSGDQFGSAVSLDGGTLLAGARYEDEKGSNAGAAYVFSGSGGSWSQQAKLTAGAFDDPFLNLHALPGIQYGRPPNATKQRQFNH